MEGEKLRRSMLLCVGHGIFYGLRRPSGKGHVRCRHDCGIVFSSYVCVFVVVLFQTQVISSVGIMLRGLVPSFSARE